MARIKRKISRLPFRCNNVSRFSHICNRRINDIHLYRLQRAGLARHRKIVHLLCINIGKHRAPLAAAVYK